MINPLGTTRQVSALTGGHVLVPGRQGGLRTAGAYTCLSSSSSGSLHLLKRPRLDRRSFSIYPVLFLLVSYSVYYHTGEMIDNNVLSVELSNRLQEEELYEE